MHVFRPLGSRCESEGSLEEPDGELKDLEIKKESCVDHLFDCSPITHRLNGHI